MPSGSLGSPSTLPKMPTSLSTSSYHGFTSSYVIGQSSPSPSRPFRWKSEGPKRREMRPQWFVRPPSMRARHQLNCVPGAVVYGSPSICHPPMHPSNSPNGRSRVEAPRRGESYGHLSIAPSLSGSHIAPASRSPPRHPPFVSPYPAMPPPPPDPPWQPPTMSERA